MHIIKKVRYYLIVFLARDMPVVLNMHISRPKGYCGPFAYFPNHKKPRIFVKNYLDDQENEAILIPERDFRCHKRR